MPSTCFDLSLGVSQNVVSLHDTPPLHVRSSQHISSCRLFRQFRPHHILHKTPRVVALSSARAQSHSQARKTRYRARCHAASVPTAVSGSPSEEKDFTALAFFRLVGPTGLALLLCNMDRICMSVAILPMAKEFGWPAGVQGLVQSGFLWGYMATQMIGGSLADKYGGRLVMAYSIFWFSLASVLMPAALSSPVAAAGWTLPAVMLARGMVGLGEGVALPAMNNLVANNVPLARRSTALGGCFTGFHTGNLVGLFLSPLLLATLGWRGLFFVFGALGLPLLAVWLAVVPKPPQLPGVQKAETPAVDPISKTPVSPNPGEVLEKVAPSQPPAGQTPADPSLAGKVGTLKLLSSKAVWAIIVVNFVNHWGYFIYLNWMPSYFVKALGVDLRASSILSFLPWTVMAVGSTSAGLLADKLIKQGWHITKVRKTLQTIAFLGPALALIILSRSKDPRLAVACMTCALGITSLGQAGFVANMSDIAPRYAGRLFGLANTFGSFAGILGVSAVGFVVEKTGSFDPVFKLTAVMYIAATVVWNLMCTGERVFQ